MSDRTKKLRELGKKEQALRRSPMASLSGRADVEAELQRIDEEFRSLEISYEKYFVGIERFEPAKEREILALRLRRMVNVYIPQTDLRFRLHGLATRFQSYSAHWDRILRLIEEGRYERHTSRITRNAGEPVPAAPAAAPSWSAPIDRIYEELVMAHQVCRITVPKREQVEEFLRRQQEIIQEKFGNRPVELTVVIENGKPKVKVRSKNTG
jgi:hypothetical protein